MADQPHRPEQAEDEPEAKPKPPPGATMRILMIAGLFYLGLILMVALVFLIFFLRS
jgi:hypothetical protein